MLNVKSLKAHMILHGYTNATIAKALGMSSRTFSSRLKTGDFGAKEIEILIDLLKLENPMAIFFAK